jgi:hypothetical protein
MELSTKVEFQGRFFQPYATQQLLTAVNAGINELVQEAETFLNDRLKRRAGGGVYLDKPVKKGGSSGHYLRSIQSTPARNLNALITDGDVDYGPWLEGVSSRNSATRFKGYHSFRLAGQHAQKLSKKVFEKYLNKFVRKVS